MKRHLALALTAVLLTTLLTACTSKPLTPDQQKAIINDGIDTLVKAMAIYNPTWNTGPILAHKAQAINDWQSGPGWQIKEVADLEVIVNDIEGMTGCNAQCQTATLVAESGLTTVIIILEGQEPASSTAVAKTKRAMKPGMKIYKSYNAYRDDWNKSAPPSAQLQ